jgi:CBS domain-containing protein
VNATAEAPSRDLSDVSVREAMHRGVLGCRLDTPLREVARIMSENRVHCVVAYGEGDAPWGLVADLDLVADASTGGIDEYTAGSAAVTSVLTITPGETLERAAQLMAEHETAHLVVVDPATRNPIGVLSTLDVARVLAAG